jgi:predicted dehydrogenase/threonine dehydrogenase-like Zn-dependent dehydrogenase
VKQVFQSLEDGTTSVVDVPAPQLSPGHVLIRTQASIISAGTERMLVDFGRANLLDKARQQPDRVKDVVDKVRTDGLAPTVQAVRSKLGQPITLGYANAGVVVGVGRGVTDLEPGDVVASNGPHAEVVSVARNLVVKVPERDGAPLPAEEAAFAPIGAIALQGIRLAAPAIGERFVVTGLGLIGLLTVQLLRAHGCQVLGLDFDSRRLQLAQRFGAQTVDLSTAADPISAADAFAGGHGVDGVLVTASTKSSEPMHQAAEMCRKRGRIVLVGVTGLELQRADFYEKELTFQVSCSYGPGRYDPTYEEQGVDYPYGFVRWTAARNFEAFLDLVADGRVSVAPMVSHRFPEPEAAAAYTALVEDPTVLGIALSYPAVEELPQRRLLARHIGVRTSATRRGRGRVAVIGAGNYTQQVLLPALKQTPAQLDTIVSRGGASAAQAANKFGFARASTDVDEVMNHDAIDTVFITTRHDTHADLTMRALRAGKHVYVEKPLAIRHDELDEIERLYIQLDAEGNAPLLMVGFNRRFAPLVKVMRHNLASVAKPKVLLAVMNAGSIPANHWTQDHEIGGGRIVGEACHHLDLLQYLAGCRISRTVGTYLASASRDTAAIQLSFEDGSIGTVQYIAIGAKRYPKERITVFADGRTLELNNFRMLVGHGWPGVGKIRGRGQDKGHDGSVRAFVESAMTATRAPIDPADLFQNSRAALEAAVGEP